MREPPDGLGSIWGQAGFWQPDRTPVRSFARTGAPCLDGRLVSVLALAHVSRSLAVEPAPVDPRCSSRCSNIGQHGVMSGGMSRRGQWGSMTERVRTENEPTPEVPPGLKHCWVTDRYGRLPGLLLEWRRTADGFQGRVVRPVCEDGGWLVVDEWLPSGLLDPA
jgi:hypothetical protein